MSGSPDIIKDGRVCLQDPGGVGFVPCARRVSNEGVSHRGATFILGCSQKVGFSGKIPEDVDGIVEAAVGMKLSREWCVFHSSYGEGGCGGGNASVVHWDTFQKGKIGVFCVCDA